MHVQLYPEYFKPYNYEKMIELFQTYMEDENNYFLVLFDAETAKGFIFYEIVTKSNTPFNKEYKSLYVHQISIEETARSSGYGKALMIELENIAYTLKVDCIELDYWVDNHVARNFYEKLGFHKKREFVRKDLDT
nr:GNAT family N-acetyltransferase [Virgibacillus salarius]